MAAIPTVAQQEAAYKAAAAPAVVATPNVVVSATPNIGGTTGSTTTTGSFGSAMSVPVGNTTVPTSQLGNGLQPSQISGPGTNGYVAPASSYANIPGNAPGSTNAQGAVIGTAPAGAKQSSNGLYVYNGVAYTGAPAGGGGASTPSGSATGLPGATGGISGPDSTYGNATSALTPTGPLSEEDFFNEIYQQLAPVISAINGAETSAETAAYAAGTQQQNDLSGELGARGLAGSGNAINEAANTNLATAANVAQAKQAQATALSSLAQFAIPQAYSDYQAAQTRNDTNAQNYITQQQKVLSNALSGLAASGLSLDDIAQSNPAEYAALLQYAGGDPNALAQLYIKAAQANLLNNGQPVATPGNTLVYGVSALDANGQPTIKTITTTLPDSVPTGYKMVSTNSTASGGVMVTYAPVGADGTTITDPSKAMTFLNGQQISGPGTPSDGSSTQSPLTGQTVGGTTLGIVPQGVSQTNALAGQAILDGDQPPTISNSISGAGFQIKAYLEANGYDLTKATEDWNAVTKWTTTENSATIVRARVAADSASTYIGNLRSLSDQWNSTNPLSPLNYANFQSALNGAQGQDAQNLAQQIQTQLSDLTADMGSVYRYGLSSTDSSLENATQTLSTNWDNGRLDSSLDVLQSNLNVRINSLNSPDNALSASGDSGSDNTYLGDTDSSASTTPDSSDSGYAQTW